MGFTKKQIEKIGFDPRERPCPECGHVGLDLKEHAGSSFIFICPNCSNQIYKTPIRPLKIGGELPRQ